MSAPDTNIEKQARKHKGPMVGMPVLVIAALALFAGFLMFTAAQSDEDTVQPALSADQ